MPGIEKVIGGLSAQPPVGTAEYRHWLTHQDFLSFLERNVTGSEFVLYAAGLHVFIYGILVPANLLADENAEVLLEWNGTGCNPYSTWSVMSSADDDLQLIPPLYSLTPEPLRTGEQLVFARSFEGRSTSTRYIEIAQRLAHVMGLHYVEERNAYCRFDRRGDVEDVVRIINSEDRRGSFTVVTILRSVLDDYMLLTRTGYLRFFESSRFDPGGFGGWGGEEPEVTRRPDLGLFYRSATTADSASYARGIQFIRPRATLEDFHKMHWSRDEEKEYATFLAQDWKHNKVRECSCDPDQLGNYFVKSDLPHGLSPAFFRPEVLQRYKADPKKYALSDRSISCREAWHLETYDVNEAGQVHTYLIYLGHLPYEEQVYWKSFNEAPKGPISRRAQQTDFRGEWSLDYDPLISLRELVRELDEAKVSWWKLRSANLAEEVHYPVTASSAEWGRELHALDKLLNEGFDTKELRRIAEGAGRTIDDRWRTLKLTEEVLLGLGYESDQTAEIVGPLRDLSSLRVQMSAHAAGRAAQTEQARILKEHSTFPAHFRHLCARCDEALRRLRKVLEERVYRTSSE